MVFSAKDIETKRVMFIHILSFKHIIVTLLVMEIYNYMFWGRIMIFNFVKSNESFLVCRYSLEKLEF